MIVGGTLSGTGTIVANGVNGVRPSGSIAGGASGGGSVTVLYGTDSSSITPTATGGAGEFSGNGGNGTARKLADPAEKEMRLRNFTEALWPGRWNILRPMTAQELKATTVLSLKLDEVSAKVRTGPPGDDEEDYALPIWAGVIPVQQQILAPIDDPRLIPGLTAPSHITDFRIG